MKYTGTKNHICCKSNFSYSFSFAQAVKRLSVDLYLVKDFAFWHWGWMGACWIFSPRISPIYFLSQTICTPISFQLLWCVFTILLFLPLLFNDIDSQRLPREVCCFLGEVFQKWLAKGWKWLAQGHPTCFVLKAGLELTVTQFLT